MNNSHINAILHYFSLHEPIAYVSIIILAVIVGAIINMISRRYPIVMMESLRQECYEYLELEKDYKPKSHLKLLSRSFECDKCGAPRPLWHLIPFLAYLPIIGGCAKCNKAFPIRYLLSQFLCVLLSLCVVYKFGFEMTTIWVLIFTWTLFCITLIDIQHQLIPDTMSIPLLWLGLLLNLNSVFATSSDSIIGAFAGYTSLWFFMHFYKMIRKIQMIGHGDFKLFAAIGAWLGWKLLPLVILLASVVGIVIGTAIILIRKKEVTSRLAFGPYIALAGWIAMVWRVDIMNYYYSLIY